MSQLRPERIAGECPNCGHLLMVREGDDLSACSSCGETLPLVWSADGIGGTKLLRTQAASSIKPTATRWLWRGWVPLGTFCILGGRQGLGKSTLGVALTARTTRGRLPGDLQGQPRGVLFASAEDSLDATLVPRLKAAGADLTRVHFPNVTEEGMPSMLTIPDDLPGIAQMGRHHDIALLFLDPFLAFLSRAHDSHRDHDVRSALAHLSQFAEETGIAVAGLMHPNKAAGTNDPLLRITGSTAFTAVARTVLILGPDPSDPEATGPSRVLAQAKNNLAPLARSRSLKLLARTIEEDGEAIETSRLVFDGTNDHSAADVVGALSGDTEHQGERSEARHFLESELAGGPASAREVLARAKELDIATKTLRRAKKELRVKSSQGSDGWVWELPQVEEGT